MRTTRPDHVNSYVYDSRPRKYRVSRPGFALSHTQHHRRLPPRRSPRSHPHVPLYERRSLILRIQVTDECYSLLTNAPANGSCGPPDEASKLRRALDVKTGVVRLMHGVIKLACVDRGWF